MFTRKNEMINLDKKTSFKLMLLKATREKGNPKTSSKIVWHCLGCLKEIVVSFNQCSLKSIYCEECFKNKVGKAPNIVELQYIRKLKETQLKMFEKFLNNQI